jgi:RNA polymerase sigma factor (sigma-70 family)
MTNQQFNPVLHFLRGLAGSKSTGDLPDSALLERFVQTHDEEAFRALLLRHGPLVLGVCRRILGESPDTEDAFQATFLVLARQASAIRKRTSLACWLHGVAARIAHRARTQAAHRQFHERQVPVMVGTDSLASAEWRDLRPILDEELARLPESYRVPLVLCYLEGQTLGEAARVLGWPEGSVSGRLARARELLRSRLIRRGITLSATGLVAALTEQVAPAAVPAVLTNRTCTAAVGFVLRQGTTGAISTSTLRLAEGVLNVMTVNRLKLMAALILMLGGMGVAVGAVAGRGEQPRPGLPEPSKPPVEFLARAPRPVAPAPARPEAPAEQPPVRDGRRAQDVLLYPQDWEEIPDPTFTLGNMLNSLSDKFSRPGDNPPFFLTFDINWEAFVAAGLKDPSMVLATPIAEKRILPKQVNVSLGERLKKILEPLQEKVPGGVTFVIRPDRVEITTRKAVREEFYPDRTEKDARLPPLIHASFTKKPLDEALREIMQIAPGFNIVLNPKASGTTAPVTATFQTVPADTAVFLLARMAGLKPVQVDNVLYVTTPEDAESIRKERQVQTRGSKPRPETAEKKATVKKAPEKRAWAKP